MCVTQLVSYKKKELFIHCEHLDSLRSFCVGIRDAHVCSILCSVRFFFSPLGLPVCLDCPFCIASSVFSTVYLLTEQIQNISAIS
jgi:hypothetical protein